MCRAALALAVVVVLGTTAAEVRAQSCSGVPSPAGTVTLQAGVGFSEDARGYGAGLNANFRGPLAVDVAFELIDYAVFDPNGRALGADVTYEIVRGRWSVCPAFLVTYARVSGLSTGLYPGPYTTITTTSQALTLGAGYTIPVAKALTQTVFGSAGLSRVHQNAKGGQPPGPYNTDVDTDYTFDAGLGLLWATRRVHFGGAVAYTSLEDADVVLTLVVGVVF